MKIVLENLTKRFPNRDRHKEEVTAVDRFSFEIPDGELVSLLGPSGCGKSTTLNMICGLETPTEGKIYFGDEDVTNLPPENRGVGMVFQSYALYPHLTVRKNILFPLENLTGKDRLSKEEMNRRAEAAAALVQISDYMERKPKELSGGQQQRVAIARALVKQPKVLLLDEPLSNLDARLRIQTRAEIRRIQQETGITTVFVTHDQEEAMSISDRMVVMKDGILQQIGRPQEIYYAPANQFVAKFLGNPPINLFEGKLCGRKVYVGDELLLELPERLSVEEKAANTGMTHENTKVDIHDTQIAGNTGERDHECVDSTRRIMIGIRPEGLVPTENGTLCCRLQSVEVMGRDTSVVAVHESAEGGSLRAILSGEDQVPMMGEEIRFAVKPHKVFLFDAGSGATICNGLGELGMSAATAGTKTSKNAGNQTAENTGTGEAVNTSEVTNA